MLIAKLKKYQFFTYFLAWSVMWSRWETFNHIFSSKSEFCTIDSRFYWSFRCLQSLDHGFWPNQKVWLINLTRSKIELQIPKEHHWRLNCAIKSINRFRSYSCSKWLDNRFLATFSAQPTNVVPRRLEHVRLHGLWGERASALQQGSTKFYRPRLQSPSASARSSGARLPVGTVF